MKTIASIVVSLAMVGILLMYELPRASTAETRGRPVIVVSTAILGSLIRDIGGDRFDIIPLIPPTSCPGHFDLKPHDVQKIRHADMIICHAYQEDLQYVLGQYVPDKKKWLIISEKHSLTIPRYFVETGEMMVERLSDTFAHHSSWMERRWERQKKNILAIEKRCAESFKNRAERYPLIVSYRQREFVESWGFPIVGVFDTPEGDSMKQLTAVIRNARKERVKAVIDNLQSSKRQGGVLAKKLGVPLIVLSNFPGVEGFGSTFEDLLVSNCSKLTEMMR